MSLYSYQYQNERKQFNVPRREQHLRLYNQFPGSYESIKAMTEDLPRIAGMGFQEVWVNPFYKSCRFNPITPHKVQSPYAMQNHHEVDPLYKGNLEDIKAYTAEAKRLKLVPLFDLVALHVAIDHPYVSGDPELFEKGIDTTTWFKRHPNGNLKIKGLDENHKQLPTSSNPYSDTAAFNYDNPEIAEQIFEYFWIPFIDQNIRELGFMGARIDAPGQIPRHVHEMILSYVNQACKDKHGRSACLVAETIGESAKFLAKDVAGISGYVTHVMNSVWWMPGVDGQGDHHYDEWLNDDNWWANGKGILQGAAPTAGHSGSHDEERIAEILEHKGISDPVVLKQRILEKIMQAAFGSDGGHILAYGDEYGVTRKINLHAPYNPIAASEKKIDLCVEIGEINNIVKKLPTPTYPEWTQRVFYEKYPELVIFIVHQGEGFTGKSHLIIGNTYNDEDKNITVTTEMLDEIMKANGRNKTPESQKKPEKLFLCGKISADPSLELEVVKSDGKRKRDGLAKSA